MHYSSQEYRLQLQIDIPFSLISAQKLNNQQKHPIKHRTFYRTIIKPADYNLLPRGTEETDIHNYTHSSLQARLNIHLGFPGHFLFFGPCLDVQVGFPKIGCMSRFRTLQFTDNNKLLSVNTKHHLYILNVHKMPQFSVNQVQLTTPLPSCHHGMIRPNSRQSSDMAVRVCQRDFLHAA